MNRRDLKGDPADFPIREIEQALLQGRVVKVSPLLAIGLLSDSHARMTVQLVKLRQPVLGQQVMHEQATPAAE